MYKKEHFLKPTTEHNIVQCQVSYRRQGKLLDGIWGLGA